MSFPQDGSHSVLLIVWEYHAVCSVDEMQGKIPNKPGESANELFVPKIVVGVAAASMHAGEEVVHPRNESCPPAEAFLFPRTALTWCSVLFRHLKQCVVLTGCK
jgi:hypothetical protein